MSERSRHIAVFTPGGKNFVQPLLVFLYRICHFQGGLVTDAVHLRHHRWFAIEKACHILVFKPVTDTGDIPQPHPRAIFGA